ncbi:MAG: hypothetical protein M3138_03115 [Actinomycetota bacterium]|nr:hypothetical protein [Actinomycetota bacterium]
MTIAQEMADYWTAYDAAETDEERATLWRDWVRGHKRTKFDPHSGKHELLSYLVPVRQGDG